MHAAACTLAGFVRPFLLRIFIGEDLPENLSPSFRAFGFGRFVRFMGALVILHHISLFFIESLTLFDPLFLAIRILAGVVTTSVFICIVEAFNGNSKRSGD